MAPSAKAIAAAQSGTPCDHLFKLSKPDGCGFCRIRLTCIHCDIALDAEIVNNSCELAVKYMQMGGRFDSMDFSSLKRKKGKKK